MQTPLPDPSEVPARAHGRGPDLREEKLLCGLLRGSRGTASRPKPRSIFSRVTFAQRCDRLTCAHTLFTFTGPPRKRVISGLDACNVEGHSSAPSPDRNARHVVCRSVFFVEVRFGRGLRSMSRRRPERGEKPRSLRAGPPEVCTGRRRSGSPAPSPSPSSTRSVAVSTCTR